MSTNTKKKQNPFAAYFKPFGLRQITDLLILIGIIVTIVGLCTVQTVTTVGLCIYIAASAIAIFRALRIITAKDVNKRSPEYKNAVINAVIMGVVALLAVLAILTVYLGW